MTTTLSEGVKVPDVGSVNWAGDLEVNWNLLNGALANLSGNVKLDRDNIWTGEQSFTLPIVGSITGTAAKAIADEDGTSIKTGYVNVAGNQTVTGQKTFSANIHFTSGLYQRNTTYEIGTTPASNINITQFLADKDSKYTGCLRNAISTTGLTSVELEARNKVGSGALSPTGNATSSTFKVEVQPDGTKTLYFDGSIRNNALPYATNTYSLGSSSYQWSSVYAQTYYYNGTAWGLDKANVWTQSQTISINQPTFTLQDTIGVRSETPASNRQLLISFLDKNGSSYGFINRQHRAGTGTHLHQVSINNGTYDYRLQFYLFTNGGSYFAPFNDGIIELGTSTNKWKTLNGVNPGALSLPDYNSTAKVDISGSIIPDQYGNIPYTPPINGWLYVCFNISNATTTDSIFYIQAKDNNVANSSFVQTSWLPAPSSTSSLSIFFPVVANKRFVMQINFSNYTIIKAHVIPCLGNV